jgi:hypothetical protein
MTFRLATVKLSGDRRGRKGNNRRRESFVSCVRKPEAEPQPECSMPAQQFIFIMLYIRYIVTLKVVKECGFKGFRETCHTNYQLSICARAQTHPAWHPGSASSKPKGHCPSAKREDPNSDCRCDCRCIIHLFFTLLLMLLAACFLRREPNVRQMPMLQAVIESG